VRFDEDRRVEILRDAWECEEGHIITSTGSISALKCTQPTKSRSARGKPLPCGAPLIRQVYSEQKRTDIFAVKIEEKEDDPDLEASSIDIICEGSELVRDVLSCIQSNEKHVRIAGVVKLAGSKAAGEGGMTMCIDAANLEHVEQTHKSRYDLLVGRHIPKERMRSHVMKLIRSYAPHISGRTDVKTGLMVAAVGSPGRRITAGSKIRGEANVLLLGSPGTGKTQMLLFMEKIRMNCVYVSGRQVSPIGLTAGIQWSEIGIAGQPRRQQVFMGAYALAQDSLVLLDEIHKREKKELEHLAGPMDDSQEIVIAKQGLFRKIPVTCGSVHAGNPRMNGGVYDKKLGLLEQMDQAHWLYSRYDLIFVLTNDDQRDSGGSVRHAIAETYRGSTSLSEDRVALSTAPISQDEERMILESEFYPVEYMASEVAWLRDNVPSKLEVGSRPWDVMMEFWEKFSKMKMLEGLADVFDHRKVNSIVRVAEGIARLYRSNVVEMEHMEEAISLFRSSITNTMNMPSSDLGFVRFAAWLVREFLDPCYLCRGKGCEACGSMGGHFIPVSLGDTADYPYQDEARKSWDYMIAVGGLVRMEESLGGQSYRITRVAAEMAAGGWHQTEERDIAKDAMNILNS
jgi:hypothetical protein